MAKAADRWQWDRLRRSRDDCVLTGLCGGLGRHFKVDAVVVRLAFLALAVANGLGVFVYLLGWITIPPEEPDEALAAQSRQVRERILLGTVLAVLGLVLLCDLYRLRMGVWVTTAVFATTGLLFLITGFRQRQQPEHAGPAQEADDDAASSSQDSIKPLSRRQFFLGWFRSHLRCLLCWFFTFVALLALAATDWVGNWGVPRFALLPLVFLVIFAWGAILLISGIRMARRPAA